MKMKDAVWLQLSVITTLFSLLFYHASAFDTITSTQTLTQNQTIVSSGKIFELGFFSAGDSNKWFIGIWYKNIPTKTVVWVANRDNPLSSSSGMLKIDKSNNNLVLTDESGKTIWQSKRTSSPSNTVAQLLDTGNFVTRREKDFDPGNYLWQSFDHPTDTLLPGMELGLDKESGVNRFLTSWKNNNDPSTGDYLFKISVDGFPEFVLWQNQIEVYRSGPWNGFRFSGLPEMGPNYVMNSTFVKDEDAYSFKMTESSDYSRLLVNSFGVLQRVVWFQTRQTWNVLWYAPSDQCDTYRQCGTFGICDTINSILCQCIKGFKPINEQEWKLRVGSEGCARTEKLNCPDDGFILIKNVKLPGSSNSVFNKSMSLVDCKKACLKNCSCTAYANMDVRSGGSGCVRWMDDLVGLRKYSEQKGGQELFVRVPKNLDEGTSLMGVILQHFNRFMETWDLRIVILASLLLQTILIFLAPFRKRVSSVYLSIPLWLAYLLADITATYALGIIAKSQFHESIGPFADPNLLALWAPFLLVHLGGPDTITALALEDNELWLRHFLNLLVQGWAVFYSFTRAFPNRRLWLPTLLMIFAGLIKYTERTRSLYVASTRRFRSSLLREPDPGPNYAKLMDEYASKKAAKLPTKIEMVPEPKPKGDKLTASAVKKLSDLEIVEAAYDFFKIFKGLIADLIFSFNERTESRSFFLERNARDAFKVVEVELNFFYEILYTKIVVVQCTLGYILRFLSIALTLFSLVLFILFHKHKIEKQDIVITYTLLIGAITLDAIAFVMSLTSDWTAVILTGNKNFLFRCLGFILRVDRDRWPAPPGKSEPTSYLSKILLFAAKVVGFKKYKETIRRRWSESISEYNLIHYCLNPRSPCLDNVVDSLGLTNMADSIKYVKTKKIDDEIKLLIFEELKMKAEVADDLETSKEINSARGDWILRFHGHYNLLPWVNDVDFDESLMLWHVATDLLYSCNDEGEEDASKNHPNYNRQEVEDASKDRLKYRRFAKRLSDYMLYLLMMQSTLMSSVAGIGEIRFRDTCAEAKIFFKGRDIKKEQGDKEEENDNEPDSKHVRGCKSLLDVDTAVKPVAVKGDRSKSVLFYACMLAKELKKLEGHKKWVIISKVWVELLCYAASRCSPRTHAAQLSKGGQFITVIWLLMAHFGLGSQFQISEGHARAKLIVGK